MKERKRSQAVRRLFAIAAFLQESGEDVSLQEIQDHVNVTQRSAWCERTIRRDVAMLIDTKCVEVTSKIPVLVSWRGFDDLINGTDK